MDRDDFSPGFSPVSSLLVSDSPRDDTPPSDELGVGQLRVDDLRVDDLRVDDLRVDEPRVDDLRVDEPRVDKPADGPGAEPMADLWAPGYWPAPHPSEMFGGPGGRGPGGRGPGGRGPRGRGPGGSSGNDDDTRWLRRAIAASVVAAIATAGLVVANHHDTGSVRTDRATAAVTTPDTSGKTGGVTPVPPKTATPPSTPPGVPPSDSSPEAPPLDPSSADPSTRDQTPSRQQLSDASGRTAGVVNIYTVLGLRQGEAAGTGIVLSSTGEVMTNNHVINGSTQVSVTVIDTGKKYTATVVGTDPTHDIAVLQLKDASGLTVAPLGDSTTVKIGDEVVAVGNAGGTGTPTTAPGTVTGLDQSVTATDESGGSVETLHHLIAVSATLQPGESGGPLYDASGKVIGVDAIGSASGGRWRINDRPSASGGGGYAIPINQALASVHQIEAGKSTSTITIGTPPMIGVGVDPNSPGAIVTFVAAGSPAAKIGIAVGDDITSVGGTTISTVEELSKAVKSHQVGDKVKIIWTDAAGSSHSGTATLVPGAAN